MLSAKDTIHIRNAFSSFDEDFSGTLNLQELKNVFTKFNYPIEQDEIEDIYDRVKDPFKKEITWTSFLYASFDDRILSKQNLKGVFKFLDSEENGYITYESFKSAF